MSELATLKPGLVYFRVSGKWTILRIEEGDEALLARPMGETTINGVHCVDFRDGRGREWAQKKE